MEDILKTKVFETLCAASMCWSEIPKGVFENIRVEELENELCEEVDKHTLKNSVERLRGNLKKDAGYYYSWQANIAMAFQDEYWRVHDKVKATGEEIDKIYNISNEAAKNFLDLLIDA